MSHCILVKVASPSIIVSVIVYLGRNKLQFFAVVTLHPILWLLSADNCLCKSQLCMWLLNLAVLFSLLILVLLHVFEKTLVCDNSLSACGFVVWPFMCFAPCSLRLWADSSDSQLLIELVSLSDMWGALVWIVGLSRVSHQREMCGLQWSCDIGRWRDLFTIVQLLHSWCSSGGIRVSRWIIGRRQE